MRLVLIVSVVVLAGCGEQQAPTAPQDPTSESWYRDGVAELTVMNREAEQDFNGGKPGGKPDDASSLILRGEPIASQLLGVPRPTLAAMEAASDLDDLYGRMLFSNQHYEWAQFQFQKNLARWKYWKPETPDTARRLQDAETKVADCDRKMLKGALPSVPIAPK